MEIKTIRLANLLEFLKRYESIKEFADKVGIAPAYISQIKNQADGRAMGSNTARRLEKALNLQDGYMDQLHGESVSSTVCSSVPKGQVPIISWAQAGNWPHIADHFQPNEAKDYIATTMQAQPRTYAVRVEGDSMVNPTGWPSFPEGMIIIVEPELDAAPGDFVIVRQNNDKEGTLKQLIKDSGRYYLKPLNPRYPILELLPDALICGVVREGIMRLK